MTQKRQYKPRKKKDTRPGLQLHISARQGDALRTALAYVLSVPAMPAGIDAEDLKATLGILDAAIEISKRQMALRGTVVHEPQKPGPTTGESRPLPVPVMERTKLP